MMQTKVLADFIASVRYEDLDEKTVDLAKMCIADTLGVAFGGSTVKPTLILRDYFRKNSPGGRAVVLDGSFATLDPASAAAINAAFAHVLEMDDVHNSSIVHLGAVTIPTALALAQSRGASGREMILATAMGYEAGARIGRAINPESYQFWHTTGVAGPFCSAAAAAKLIGLNGTELANAFGTAGTQASGLWAFLKEGAMSKLIHVANASLCGIRSAELAQLGFTGATDVLESDRGFVKAMATHNTLESITENLGKPFEINHNSFKPYACCRHTHSANYGIFTLKERYGIDPDEIESIEDLTYETAFKLTGNSDPTNPYAAKFSLPYCIAAALLFPALNDAAFSEEHLHDPRLRALIDRIHVRVDDEIEALHTKDPDCWAHLLRITLKNGTVYEERFDYPFGDYKNPFDWDAVYQKYLGSVEGVLSPAQAQTFFEKLRDLDTLRDVNELFQF